MPIQFFVAGRPMGKVDTSMAHFRALRSTSGAQRERALGFVEQVWELTHALEKRVQLPPVNLPGFTGGEVYPGIDLPDDPVGAARALRRHWRLGDGPVRHLARRMESHGLIVVAPVEADEAASKVDAFSSSGLLRPVIVLTPNRADDVYRYRFSAAHELGHLVLHAGATGDSRLEREADAFAAEFLTPQKSILPLLSRRVDLAQLAGPVPDLGRVGEFAHLPVPGTRARLRRDDQPRVPATSGSQRAAGLRPGIGPRIPRGTAGDASQGI
ncbi:ImmA/IrrE family metallo-endopeptidase [Streptomyces sp. PG2]